MSALKPNLHADARWTSLYRIGGAAALIIALLIPLQAAVFIVSPPPGAVVDYLTLYQTNRLLGLLDLDFLMIVDQILMVPIILALYVALRRANESFMVIAAALAFLGIAAYFASREATFSMLSLSDAYAAATTEAQRAMVLAAGQAMLASYNGTAFQISYNIGQLAGIIISVAMLQDPVRAFSKVAAWAGILGNLIGWGLYMPTIGIYISLFSVLGLWIWYILVGRRLLQMGQALSTQEASRGSRSISLAGESQG